MLTACSPRPEARRWAVALFVVKIAAIVSLAACVVYGFLNSDKEIRHTFVLWFFGTMLIERVHTGVCVYRLSQLTDLPVSMTFWISRFVACLVILVLVYFSWGG